MARSQNAVETHVVKISTTPWVVESLEFLATTGRFGKNAAEVAEELLRGRLREVELDGWLALDGSKPMRGRRKERA